MILKAEDEKRAYIEPPHHTAQHMHVMYRALLFKEKNAAAIWKGETIIKVTTTTTKDIQIQNQIVT